MPADPQPSTTAQNAAEMRLQIEQMAEADNRFVKITRITGFSNFNVKMLYIFGGITIAMATMNWMTHTHDYANPLIGLALVGLGYCESVGRSRMLACDPSGPKLLAINQVVLLAAFAVYIAYSIYQTKNGPKSQIETIGENMGISSEDARQATVSIYQMIFALTAVFQLLMAWVYHRLTAKLQQHVELTPPWIIAVQRKRNR